MLCDPFRTLNRAMNTIFLFVVLLSVQNSPTAGDEVVPNKSEIYSSPLPSSLLKEFEAEIDLFLDPVFYREAAKYLAHETAHAPFSTPQGQFHDVHSPAFLESNAVINNPSGRKMGLGIGKKNADLGKRSAVLFPPSPSHTQIQGKYLRVDAKWVQAGHMRAPILL